MGLPRQFLVARDPESSAELGDELPLLEAVLLWKIRALVEVTAVEGLDHQGPSGPQGFDHRRPERAVEKSKRDEDVIPLPREGEAREVAVYGAHVKAPFPCRGGELSQSLEAPIEGLDGKALLGEVEGVRAETASDVEGAPRREVTPTLDEKGSGLAQKLGVPMLLVPPPSI